MKIGHQSLPALKQVEANLKAAGIQPDPTAETYERAKSVMGLKDHGFHPDEAQEILSAIRNYIKY